MIIEQFFVRGLAHSSYLLAADDTCAIIDPQRDTQLYIDSARARGLRITHILQTHLHADFISGHMDLAEQTGATIYAPRAANCQFDHVALEEGDTFQIEDLRFSVLDTAGHTPEHISYVVADLARSEEPVAVFCGDTLFVGDVGRPDLFPGKAQELAGKLYDNLHNKLMKLPDFCEVYPAHGAGSLCGRAMSAKRSSTIGYERRFNAALQITDKEEFIASLTTNMPAAPDHFSRCSAINGAGPALVRTLPTPEPMSAAAFAEAAARPGTLVLDCREYDAFGAQHVADAWHIDFTGNFATFAGWILPPDNRILLVAVDETTALDAAVWLRRVGLDQVVGFLDDGMFAWARAGLPTEHVPQLCARELYEMTVAQTPMTLVDVRAPHEFQTVNIQGAVNIPGPDLRTRAAELPPDVPVTVICSSGQRSSMASSIIQRQGIKNVRNVAGGMGGYGAAGYARECPVCVAPHGPRYLGGDTLHES